MSSRPRLCAAGARALVYRRALTIWELSPWTTRRTNIDAAPGARPRKWCRSSTAEHQVPAISSCGRGLTAYRQRSKECADAAHAERGRSLVVAWQASIKKIVSHPVVAVQFERDAVCCCHPRGEILLAVEGIGAGDMGRDRETRPTRRHPRGKAG